MDVIDHIDISPENRDILISLLLRYLPDTTVWVFGSRTKGTSRPESDIDLVVFSTPEQWENISDLKEEFDESMLPFRVDLMVWNDLPPNFKMNIMQEHAALVESSRDKCSAETQGENRQ